MFPILQVNPDPDLFVYCCDFAESAIKIVQVVIEKSVNCIQCIRVSVSVRATVCTMLSGVMPFSLTSQAPPPSLSQRVRWIWSS